jgi:hypothetical protein
MIQNLGSIVSCVLLSACILYLPFFSFLIIFSFSFFLALQIRKQFSRKHRHIANLTGGIVSKHTCGKLAERRLKHTLLLPFFLSLFSSSFSSCFFTHPNFPYNKWVGGSMGINAKII